MKYMIGGEGIFGKISSKLQFLCIPSKENDYQPPFLESRILLSLVAVILIVKILSFAVYLPFDKNFFFADITKTDLVQMLNQSRKSLGLNELTQNEKLDKAAALKAQDMVNAGYFAHVSPSGATPWSWFAKAGYTYKYAGENLAIGFMDSQAVYEAWLASPGHKANLLNPNYQEVGTAVLAGFGPNNSIVVVQEFGSQPVKAAPAAVKPAPVKPTPNPAPNPVAQAPEPEPTPSVVVEEAELPAAQENPVVESTPTPERVLAGSTQTDMISGIDISSKNTLYARFINFMVYDNNVIIAYISYGLLMVILACLLVGLMIDFQAEHKPILIRTLSLIAVIFLSTLIDKNMVMHIIPYYVTL